MAILKTSNAGRTVSSLALTLTLALTTLYSNAQKNPLFKSAELTPVKSFTRGAEGPAVDSKGIVYAVNYGKEGTIGQVSPDGKSGLFIELPSGSVGNGIRFDSKGNMLIADYTRHNVLKVNMQTKEISVFAHNPEMSQPNDIAIDDRDRLFASDPNWKEGTGRIWRIDLDGKSTLLETMGTTNGIEVSPDNKYLYVNESVQRKVWKYDLNANGEISNKRLIHEFPDFGMDGMRCDAKGNLYITRHGKGAIAILSPEGKLLKEIPTIGKLPSNIAFGGKDGRTVYITLQDRGNMESFRVEHPGREWKMLKNK